jgi:nucleoside-diphosphate-sugar epimerase
LGEHFSHQGDDLLLLARSPERAAEFAASLAGPGRAVAMHPDALSRNEPFDILVNCVGLGDPKLVVSMGEKILEVTGDSDDLALSLVRERNGAVYVFLSSGIVHNDLPARVGSRAPAPKAGESAYRRAKRNAEARHRMLDLPIVDLRLFGFVSRFLDPDGSFFLSQLFAAVRDQEPLETTPGNMIRDYAHPSDLGSIIRACASAPASRAIDVYTRAPVDKHTLLALCASEFGLRQTVLPSIEFPGEEKPGYYSLDRSAADLGYEPEFSAEEAVVATFRALLDRR